MAVPYTFGTATSSIPLSQLDSNFATVITLGNTAIQLGNTVTTLNNMTLANVTISSGNVTITNVAITTANVTTANITTAVIGTETVTTSTITTANVTTANITTGNITNGTVITSLTLSYGTANGVTYFNGSKVLTSGSALTFDGTNFATTGTATATKLIPTGSSATGNGLYLPAANSVGLSTNGTNAVYIDSTQNVIVGGTSTLGARFAVIGTASGSNNYIQITNPGIGTATIGFTAASGNVKVYNSYATGVLANGVGIDIDTSGNVGIGTTSPGQKLDVVSTANSGVSIRVNSSNAGSSTFGSLIFGNDADSSVSSIQQNSSTNTTLGGGNSLNIFSKAGAMTFSTASTERMRIDSSGNVGIGTSSPGTKLQAVGIIKSGATGTNGEFNLARTSDGLSVGKITLTESTSILDYNNLLGAGLHTFTINSVERVRINSNGELLITTAAGLGYGTGSGGTVTQATSKGTGVTLNKPTGQITMDAAALLPATQVGFTLTNSLLTINDVVVVNIDGFSGTSDAYNVWAAPITGGAYIFVKNISAGSLSEAIRIHFAIIKGATS